MFEIIFIPISMGLLGAGHCLAMCGGIVAALSFSNDSERAWQKQRLLIGYNLGRLISYTSLGLIAGTLGSQLSFQVFNTAPVPIIPLISALLILMLGFYLMGMTYFLSPLEWLGSKVWRYVQPIGKRFIPIKTFPQAVLVGCIWGWLPCGLVYTALVYALTQDSALSGALVMLCFGLGTLPALLMGGLAGQGLKKLLQARILRLTCGTLMIVYGLWSLTNLSQHRGHHGAHIEPADKEQVHDHSHH